jgi:signal recognition particle subunit SRP54
MDQEVLKSLTPSQQVVKIVRDELLALFGDAKGGLVETAARPRVILMLGLQGSGKTTTTGKLAKWLRSRAGTRWSCRPTCAGRRPSSSCRSWRRRPACGCTTRRARWTRWRARRARWPRPANVGNDVVIVDTAGRLHIDDELMAELAAIARRWSRATCSTSPTR